jgi:hypothetical protein
MPFRRSKSFPVISLLFVAACASSPKEPAPVRENPAVKMIATAPGSEIRRNFRSGGGSYSVLVHSPVLAPLLRDRYSAKDLKKIRGTLGKSLDFAFDSRGLVRAADRVGVTDNDPTHYDAVWVRDSLWIYLGLRSDPSQASAANRLLLALADYFSSPAQLARFDAVIANPGILSGAYGQMNAVHIRFDRRSPDFADVQDGGKPQVWNHKQNDALGLFLDLFCRAVLEAEVGRREITDTRMAMIARFPKYFAAVKFEAMADAGSWEEIERVNTSSIGLVTSGLERLMLAKTFFPGVKSGEVNALIQRGYATIRHQLALGGESPGYPPADPHFRAGDAALLNLIYPAKLARLTRPDFDRILAAVKPLVGEVGIRRYHGDSYQSGNFWFRDASTDNTSSEASFAGRGSRFIPGSEAQWFFDSWFSVANATLAHRFGDARFHADAVRFLNRALGQVTGPSAIGADGKPVPALALPESYNTVVDPRTDARAFVPSPITPLNWAKASLRLALTAH